MRIISGKNKGKRLMAPAKLPVRPTTDFAKESLFNILNNYFYFDEISVLDLFAGTGNISYEFASRGCQSIVAVDAHLDCVRFIEKISRELQFDIQVIKSDVYAFLDKNKRSYDVIFADPPYEFAQQDFEQIVQKVMQNQLLDAEGFLIIEHSKHTDLEHLPEFVFSKKYSGNMFSFFQNLEPNQ